MLVFQLIPNLNPMTIFLPKPKPIPLLDPITNKHESGVSRSEIEPINIHDYPTYYHLR